jgi:hypothetical protein
VKKHGMKIMGFLVIWVCVTGCATMGDVIQSKERGEGTRKVYPVNADQAWEIAKAVFRWERTDAIEEHRSEGYMLTSSRESLISWGTVMGVWIESVDNDNTRVTAIIKRRNPAEFLTSLTETTFHEEFELAASIKAGKSFSSAPPTAKSQFVPPPKPTTSMAVTLPPSTHVVTVTWTFANIRSGAGNDYSLVATVKRGDKLTIIGEYGDWLNVRLENGQEGWIHSKTIR